MYQESESVNEGVRLRYMTNRCRQVIGEGGVFRIFDEPESPSAEGM